MLDTQAAETQLSDHVARFWNLLQTETVRICLDLKRVVATEAPDGPVVYWDGSTFSDDVAKAVVAERAAKASENAELREALHNTKSALTNVAYLDVTNLGSEAETKRPSRYFECRLCGDWNDRIKHIRHAEGCPLSDYQI